jgi:peptidoglycan-associated lipoprotein
MKRKQSILPSTLLIALVATSLTGAGCKSKSKPAATTPAESETDGASPGPSGAEAKPDSTGGDQPLAGNDPSLTGVVFFEFDSSTLTEAGRAALEGNAEWLKQDAKRTLTIEGHTDEAGTAEYNLALGERRARAAQDYLLRLGVEPERVRVLTFGEEKPAGTDDSENRRAVFISAKP